MKETTIIMKETTIIKYIYLISLCLILILPDFRIAPYNSFILVVIETWSSLSPTCQVPYLFKNAIIKFILLLFSLIYYGQNPKHWRFNTSTQWPFKLPLIVLSFPAINGFWQLPITVRNTLVVIYIAAKSTFDYFLMYGVNWPILEKNRLACSNNCIKDKNMIDHT